MTRKVVPEIPVTGSLNVAANGPVSPSAPVDRISELTLGVVPSLLRLRTAEVARMSPSLSTACTRQ
jgi:hypothetical protein